MAAVNPHPNDNHEAVNGTRHFEATHCDEPSCGVELRREWRRESTIVFCPRSVSHYMRVEGGQALGELVRRRGKDWTEIVNAKMPHGWREDILQSVLRSKRK